MSTIYLYVYNFSDAKEEIAALRIQLSSLGAENSELKANMQKLGSINSKNGQMIKSISSFCTPGQIKRLEKPGHLLHWSADDIANAIAIHSAGARAYRMLLKRQYPLPSVPTLRRWCAKVPIRPGVIEPVIKIMEMTDFTPLQRICVLSFDEMKIKKQYLYDKVNDETLKPANYVQVAMIRGLFGNWKQPIYFQFDCSMTKSILEKIVSKVEHAGFTVFCVCRCLRSGRLKSWLFDRDANNRRQTVRHESGRCHQKYLFFCGRSSSD